MKRLLLLCAGLPAVFTVGLAMPARPAPLAPNLRNPVWVSEDNLRDPSVLVVEGGYQIFYSRLVGPDWASPESWTIARAFTWDFSRFSDITDVSPKRDSRGSTSRWPRRMTSASGNSRGRSAFPARSGWRGNTVRRSCGAMVRAGA